MRKGNQSDQNGHKSHEYQSLDQPKHELEICAELSPSNRHGLEKKKKKKKHKLVKSMKRVSRHVAIIYVETIPK